MRHRDQSGIHEVPDCFTLSGDWEVDVPGGAVRVSAEVTVMEESAGLDIPRWFTIIVQRDGFDAQMHAEYSPESGRYEAREVTIGMSDHSEVTSDRLRGLPIGALLREGAQAAIKLDSAFAHWQRPERGSSGPTDEELRYAARVYRVAVLLEQPPSAAVAEMLGITPSAARNWATRARDRGYLTVQDRRARK